MIITFQAIDSETIREIIQIIMTQESLKHNLSKAITSILTLRMKQIKIKKLTMKSTKIRTNTTTGLMMKPDPNTHTDKTQIHTTLIKTLTNKFKSKTFKNYSINLKNNKQLNKLKYHLTNFQPVKTTQYLLASTNYKK